MKQGRLITTSVGFVVSLTAFALIATSVDSLRWRYQHDSPLMIYAGFLVGNGLVPYRDFFDMNALGVYLIMAAIGLLGGWDDLPFRVFDLLCLAVISTATFLWMYRFGRLPAFAGATVFPILYLHWGPMMSLQREYIALVPFALALAVILPAAGTVLPAWRIFLAGLLIGIASLVKPQFLVFSLPVFIMQAKLGLPPYRQLTRLVFYAAGVLFVVLIAVFYLVLSGGAASFVDIATGYWPLYTSMTGDHRPIAGLSRLLYIVEQTARGTLMFWLPMATIGLISISNSHKHHASFLIICALISLVYPGISGQFWQYHWLPAYYILSSVSMLSIRMLQFENLGGSIGKIALAVAVIASLMGPTSIALIRMQSGANHHPPKAGVPDEIAAFLRLHMEPGDTVQPLDWTGGAVHGMLMARAPLATRFMYDFHFYHHITHPYIRQLRHDFMAELEAKKPAFVIQILQNKPWPRGPETTREFPELQSFLERYYVPAQESARYRILRRRDQPVLGFAPSLDSTGSGGVPQGGR